jgi:hypothetical protein
MTILARSNRQQPRYHFIIMLSPFMLPKTKAKMQSKYYFSEFKLYLFKNNLSEKKL